MDREPPSLRINLISGEPRKPKKKEEGWGDWLKAKVKRTEKKEPNEPWTQEDAQKLVRLDSILQRGNLVDLSTVSRVQRDSLKIFLERVCRRYGSAREGEAYRQLLYALLKIEGEEKQTSSGAPRSTRSPEVSHSRPETRRPPTVENPNVVTFTQEEIKETISRDLTPILAQQGLILEKTIIIRQRFEEDHGNILDIDINLTKKRTFWFNSHVAIRVPIAVAPTGGYLQTGPASYGGDVKLVSPYGAIEYRISRLAETLIEALISKAGRGMGGINIRNGMIEARLNEHETSYRPEPAYYSDEPTHTPVGAARRRVDEAYERGETEAHHEEPQIPTRSWAFKFLRRRGFVEDELPAEIKELIKEAKNIQGRIIKLLEANKKIRDASSWPHEKSEKEFINEENIAELSAKLKKVESTLNKYL